MESVLTNGVKLCVNGAARARLEGGWRVRGTTNVDKKSVLTLVTAYYRFPSKHNYDEYIKWMGNLLLRVTTPIHLFTDCHTLSVDIFTQLLRKRQLVFPSRMVVDRMDYDKTKLAKTYGMALKSQETFDLETARGHSVHLYLVWLLKAEALKVSSERNYFRSDWFFWCDIGALRDSSHPFRTWPNPHRLKNLARNRIIMSLPFPFPGAEKRNPRTWLRRGFVAGEKSVIYEDHIAGTYVLAPRQLTVSFYHTLNQTYRLLLSNNHLIVKDQTAYNAMYILHPNLFTLVPSPQRRKLSFWKRWFMDPPGRNEWTYFPYWLNDECPEPKSANQVERQ